MKKSIVEKDLLVLGKKLDEFEKFIDGLTKLDRMNFESLIGLGRRVIEKLPEGQYRDMAIFALCIAESQAAKEKE